MPRKAQSGTINLCFVPAALLAFVAFLSAQTPLENTGKPMRVPFECTEADTQAASLSCSEEEPCPVFLELSSVEAAGNKIFLAGNLHTSTTTLYSVLLATEDGGKTWTRAVSPHPLRRPRSDPIHRLPERMGLRREPAKHCRAIHSFC